MGGSGGSSGAVSYPAYIQTAHGLLLDSGGSTTPSSDIITSYNTAVLDNPYTGLVAYDPDAAVDAAFVEVEAFKTLSETLNATTDYETFYTAARDIIDEETTVLDDITTDNPATVAAYDAILTDQLNDISLPQFNAAMLNIGAVNTSSFIIGQALLMAYKNRDVGKFSSDLVVRQEELRTSLLIKHREIIANHKIRRGELVRQAAVQMMAELIKKVEFAKDVSTITNDLTKIKLIAKKEESAEQADYDSKAASWEIQLYQYIANFIAAPGGGTAPTQQGPSKAVSALSGAISGAATGAAAGGGVYGAIAGAVIGAGLALAQ